MAASAAKRGLLGSWIDRFANRSLGLYPETCNYSITRVEIPMDDGVKILADLYQPIDPQAVGTILVRTPYGIGLPQSIASARVLAARGYNILLSNCRGRFGSEGTFEPARNEAADGQATVVWMRQQDWYTGSFATLGGSYLGFAQWALMSEPPHDMKAVVIYTGMHDFAETIKGTGAVGSDIVAWANFTTEMNLRGTGLSFLLYARSQKKKIKPVFDCVPIHGAIDKLFASGMPAWLDKFLTMDIKDPWFDNMRQSQALDKVDVPILLITGWDDTIMPSVMHQYEVLEKRACNVALIVGPWSHVGIKRRDTAPEVLRWMDRYLTDRQTEPRPSPVRVYITGAQEWRNLPRWPLPTTPYELYLHPDHKLMEGLPTDEHSQSTFDFDPVNPTPSIGVPLIFDNGTGRSSGDTTLGKRSDVIVFETATLDRDIEVSGRPVIELQHSTSHPNADILVLLSEVNAAGESISITEQYLRLPTERQVESLKLVFVDCGHRFKRGVKIRLLIAGGSHPRYIRNLGTDEDPVKGTKMQMVQHTVRHEAGAFSKLTLPVTES